MKSSRKGFTIIEVVLVLAIAGLIFLMVFIALPALQRSQRNTQRRNDLSRFVAQVNAYRANNKGTVPFTGSGISGRRASAASFVISYMDSSCTENGSSGAFVNFANCGEGFTDPSGNSYGVILQCDYSKSSTCGNVQVSDVDYYFNVVVGGLCSDDDEEFFVRGNSSDRQFAVAYRLEGSGVACMDNR